MKNNIQLLILLLGFNAIAQITDNRFYSQPFPGTQMYLGQFGKATLEIDDARSDGLITKPLIVAEGFDSGLLGVESGLGDNDLDSFIRSVNRSDSNNIEFFLTGSTRFTAGDQDYDIIYVNWDNGRDYLQRNALLLEDIIIWVNQQKALAGSTEKNVVLGQSMGGVIARYALADMEQRSMVHDTKLYISHDAPHQGANIPLGIQYFARHLADQFVGTPLGDFQFEVSNGGNASIEEISALLNSTGTKQLLDNYITPSFSLENSVHNDWQTDLLSKGYPTQTRNIAISNGSHCANTQDYDYNASLFRMNGNARTGILSDILGSLLGVSDDIALAVVFNEPALLLGVLPGSSKFNLDFDAKALPIANQTANIYKGKVSFTKKLLWIANITVNLTNRSYDNPVNLSYDKYAGGRYELFGQIADINLFDDNGDLTQFQADLLNLLGSVNINFNVENTFGFIPTASALDVGQGNVILNDTDYSRVYNAANPPTGNRVIPFQNFITAFENNNSINERHISFNTRNGDWLAAELNAINIGGTPQVFDCTYVCSTSQISGLDAFCTSATYSASATGATTFTWAITQGANLVNLTGNGTANIALTALPNVSGQVTLSLIMGGSCGNIALTKTIWVGIPYPIFSNANGSQTGSTFNYGYNGFGNFGSFTDEINLNNSLGVNNGVLGAEYEVFDPASNTYVPRGNGSTVVVNSADAYQFEDMVYINVRGRFLSDCGWSEWGDLTLTSFAEYFNQYTVYPNPSNDVINIEIAKKESQLNNQKKQQPTNASTRTGELFDLMGKSMRKVQIKSDIASISVAGLPKGIYVLKIYIDGKTESHQIGVK
nr:T9SS type A sorting domain-containing protein [uncultured Flavobacterium sp.]